MNVDLPFNVNEDAFLLLHWNQMKSVSCHLLRF